MVAPNSPNSDNTPKPSNPFGTASTPSKTLPLAKPKPRPKPPTTKPDDDTPTNGGFVPHPDMAEIEAKRKAYEDAAKRSAKTQPDSSKPTTPPDAKASDTELDKTFGKKDDKPPIVNPDHWARNQSNLNKFYGNLDTTFKSYQVPHKERSACIHKALDVGSIFETKLPPLDAEIKVKAYIEREYMATKKLTPEDWSAWLKEKGWRSADVLKILSDTNEERGLGQVKGLGEWPSLETAEKIMLDHLAVTNGSHEEPAEPPAQTKSSTSAPASRAGTGNNPFRPAVFTDSKLRMAMFGPSGSGKTYTALNIGCHMLPDGKVAVIDTERGTARKYAKYFKFDVTELRSYHPDTYIKAINDSVAFGYDVLVIDSLSHAWEGEKGILSMVKDGGGSFDKWKEANPVLWKLINTILDAPIHVIATMRVKTDYLMQDYTDRNGQIKQKPVKVGLAPRMKDGIEYEFDVCAEIDMENTMIVTKSRYLELASTSYPKAGKEVADALNKALTA